MTEAAHELVADLSGFRRRFVRAKVDPDGWLPEEETWEEYTADNDTFFCGIASAEMAAHHNLIDCAGCGSTDIERMPLRAPWRFRTVTTKTGALYGYAVCIACEKLSTEDLCTRIDAVFDRLVGHAEG